MANASGPRGRFEDYALLWGLIGAVGVYAQDRTALIGTREAKVENYKDATHELDDIEVKLRSLNTERTAALLGVVTPSRQQCAVAHIRRL
jgi:hypothetical protein